MQKLDAYCVINYFRNIRKYDLQYVSYIKTSQIYSCSLCFNFGKRKKNNNGRRQYL